MRKIAFLSLIILSVLFVGCTQNSNTGKFVKAPSPIDVPEGLEENGKFSFGYMEVPELHENPNGKRRRDNRDGLCILWKMGGRKCAFSIMTRQIYYTFVWMIENSL